MNAFHHLIKDLEVQARYFHQFLQLLGCMFLQPLLQGMKLSCELLWELKNSELKLIYRFKSIY